LAGVVQEVDVALLQRLSRLAKSALLHTKLSQLPCHRAKALSLLLANAKLLRGQLANALGHALELLTLLAVDACGSLSRLVARLRLLHQQVGDVLVDGRLLARQSTALRSQVAVLLACLQELACCALAQLSLLHTELTEALPCGHLVLRQVAVKTRCGLSELRLLRCLGTNGLANVGQLPCGGLAKLGTLCFQVAHLAARLHAKTSLLCGQLSGLLLQPTLCLSALAKQAADTLKQLRLLARLAGLCLLELSHLHGGLSVKACFLKALLSGLKAELTLLTGKLALQACLLRGQLSGLLAKACLLRGSPDLADTRLLQHASRLHSSLLVGQTKLPLHGLVGQCSLLLGGKVLLANSQPGLLVGQRRLERGLLVHARGLQSVGFLLNTGLLLVVQVCKGSLQPCLGPQLLYPKLRSKVLLANSQPRLLVG
jgi:hypothetical protein